MNWSVGLTTVLERRHTLLPRTLASLRAGGFCPDSIRLFIDGYGPDVDDASQLAIFCHVTERGTRIGAWANWWLGMCELHAREPNADRYVMFQDDVVCVKNLRQYLERSTTQTHSIRGPMFHTTDRFQQYWSLYTFDLNEQVIAAQPHGTWHQSAELIGQGKHQRQCGKGALGLVLSNQGLEMLLSSPSVVNHCRSMSRGKVNIDGTVCDAMNALGWREMVHCPSLLNHTGLESIISQQEIRPPGVPGHGSYPPALTFPGESFDALTWIK